jgi:hypothetical protein
LLSNLFIYVVDTAVRIMTRSARLALFVLIHEASPLRCQNAPMMSSTRPVADVLLSQEARPPRVIRRARN